MGMGRGARRRGRQTWVNMGRREGLSPFDPFIHSFTTFPLHFPVHSDEAPACSTRWAKDEGTTVWCEAEGLVPRRLQGEEEGKGGRCVCVDPTEAGAHDAGKLVVYPGCDPHADKCTF